MTLLNLEHIITLTGALLGFTFQPEQTQGSLPTAADRRLPPRQVLMARA